MTETVKQMKQDIAPQWTELLQRVREKANTCLKDQSDCSPPADLAREAIRLCSHVDRMHADLRELIDSLDATHADGTGASDKTPDEHEIDMAAIEVQQETHEMSTDPRDILKALLMWRDDPAERVQ